MAHDTMQPSLPSAADTPSSARDDASTSSSDTGSLFFIGNATVLLRLGPFAVLTDPNFLHQGESVGIGYGLIRSKRLTEPAISIDALPPLDMVVLSHHHEDHFDRVATEQLNPVVPTPSCRS